MSPLVPPGLGLYLLHHGSLNPVFKSPSNIFNAELYKLSARQPGLENTLLSARFSIHKIKEEMLQIFPFFSHVPPVRDIFLEVLEKYTKVILENSRWLLNSPG